MKKLNFNDVDLFMIKLIYNNMVIIYGNDYDPNNVLEISMSYHGLDSYPIELCQLTKLRRLTLNHNSITKLPTEIGQLTKLHILHVMSNHLKELPKEIGNLINLKVLYLSINQLTNIPKEIKSLKLVKGGRKISRTFKDKGCNLNMGLLSNLLDFIRKIKTKLYRQPIKLRTTN